MDFRNNKARRRFAKRASNLLICLFLFGGAKRIRTAGLCSAIAALYQLSYSPTPNKKDTGFLADFGSLGKPSFNVLTCVQDGAETRFSHRPKVGSLRGAASDRDRPDRAARRRVGYG